MPPDQRPGIVQVLQDFIVDDAVNAIGDGEGQGSGLGIRRGDFGQIGRRPGCGIRITFDAQQPGGWIKGAIGGHQRPVAAAHIKDRARG